MTNYVGNVSTRGEVSWVVRDTVTGEEKGEGSKKNMLATRFYADFLYDSMNQDASGYIRIVAGNVWWNPSAYNYTTQNKWATCSLTGFAGQGYLGQEDSTGLYYIQWKMLIQVTGAVRSYNCFSLEYRNEAENIIDPPIATTPYTMVKLDDPVIQGPTDQVEVSYRLYFEGEGGVASVGARDYAYLFSEGALDVNNVDYSFSGTRGLLTQEGMFPNDGWSTTRYYISTTRRGAYGVYFGADAFGTTDTSSLSRHGYSGFKSAYSSVKHAITDPQYLIGSAYNYIRDYSDGSNGMRYHRAMFDTKSYDQDNGDRYNRMMESTYDRTFAGKGPRYALGSAANVDPSPYKRTLTHDATDFRIGYNPSNLPTGTYVPSFSGTWAADDHTPLLARTWIDNGGPVDGTATYKMAFCRFFNFQYGMPNDDETFGAMGTSVLGSAGGTSSNTDHQNINGPVWHNAANDPDWMWAKYENSSFGNAGAVNGAITNYVSSYQPPDYATNSSASRSYYCDNKRFRGLDNNSWWGWSYDTKHLNRAGVEFNQLAPHARKRWTMADIGCNQIDWVEHIKGIPGEVDEEEVLVVDSTSGIYRLNYTQNTVTVVTGELGFISCTYTKSGGIEEITALKHTDNGDGTYTGSMHSNLISNFAGTDADFWASVPLQAPQWWADNNGTVFAIRRHYRHPRFLVMKRFEDSGTIGWRTGEYVGDLATGTWVSTEIVNQYTSGTNYGAGWYAMGENYYEDPRTAFGITWRWYADIDFEDIKNHVKCVQDWVTFHPHGMEIVIKGNNWLADAMEATRSCITINSVPTDPGFLNSQADTYMHQSGWECPHDLRTLPQQDGSVCYIWAGLCTTSLFEELPYSANTSFKGQYIYAPTTSSSLPTAYEKKTKFVISPLCYRKGGIGHNSSDAGYSRPWSTSNVTPMGSADLPGYKGITSDGVMKYHVPCWVKRDQSDVDTSAKAVVSTSRVLDGSGEVDQWPLDPDTDEYIMNPQRWDVFGWDSTAGEWVKEEWKWNYDTEIWIRDPSTVHSGKPIAVDTLDSLGIAEYPYNQMSISWTNLRPSASTAPSYGENASQVIYNGNFIDGATRYEYMMSGGRTRLKPVTFTKTADSKGIIAAPNLGVDFAHLDFLSSRTWSVIRDSDQFQFSWRGYDSNDEGQSAENQYDAYRFTVRVPKSQAGESFTIKCGGLFYQEDVLATENGSWLKEDMPVTAGGLKSPLFADVGTTGITKQAVVDAGGWTELVTNGTGATSLQWIDTTLAPFSAYFPSGVPSGIGRFARYLVLQPYYYGWFSSDTINGLSESTNYAKANSSYSDSAPTNSLIHYYDGTTYTPYNTFMFYKEHTDAEGRNWLVILQGRGTSSSSTADAKTLYELWYPQSTQGQTMEVRWIKSYAKTQLDANPNFSMNVSNYLGFSARDERGSTKYGEVMSYVGPKGPSGGSYSYSIATDGSMFERGWHWEGERWVFDLRPTKESFVTLTLPPV